MLFERAAVLQISGDARCAKDVVANARSDASGFGAALNHRIGVGLGQGVAGELSGRPAVALEQQRLRLVRQPRAVDVCVKVLIAPCANYRCIVRRRFHDGQKYIPRHRRSLRGDSGHRHDRQSDAEKTPWLQNPVPGHSQREDVKTRFA